MLSLCAFIQSLMMPTWLTYSGTTTTEAQMSIPQGETPITTLLTNPLTDPTTLAPTIQTSTPEMSIPGGETPTVAPSTITTPLPSPSNNGTTTPTGPVNSTTLSTSAGPSQQPTSGAVPVYLQGNGQAWVSAVAASGLSVVFGFAWALL